MALKGAAIQQHKRDKNIMSYLLILAAGFLGVLGHWVTRWAQGRTTSSFFEYLQAYKARTLSSGFATLASASAIYLSMPVGSSLMTFLLMSYCASYTMDSKVNKDKDPETN